MNTSSKLEKKQSYIDLFSGCGGLSLGFSFTNKFNRLFAVEKNSDAFLTYSHNLLTSENTTWPSWLEKRNWDILELISNHKDRLKSLSGRVDLIVGGPPCQGFSLAGKRLHADERNSLSFYYLELIRIINPKAIFFENVKGFCMPFKDVEMGHFSYSDHFLQSLDDLGYQSQYNILDFSKYGVPQRRERFILFATRNDINVNPNIFFEELENTSSAFLNRRGLKCPITVGDAIGDLLQSDQEKNEGERFLFGGYSSEPFNEYQQLMRKGSRSVMNHRFPNHCDNVKNKFSEIINEKLTKHEIKERFSTKKNIIQLLDKGKPSPTLTTLPDDYVHYSEPRVLTPREYARIQSFPDSFVFHGKYTTGGKQRKLDVPIYTQIGNAVPPLFAELAGDVIGEILNGI